ncbi:hypothetical protein SAMN05216185_1226 [Pseudomonas guariconensis]|uniref:hypothetical protein n=1 Tax=Pseudomonas guariconensis TaxID=1288410 RepID=UPI00087EDA80|nr:hypothetical protein [Pseudomonas guariconensis]SDE24527.1 hypothetical protein SAMN05216185_1226 [Pseudomonas guariconensis]
MKFDAQLKAVSKKVMLGAGVVPIALGLYVNQSKGAQSESEAVVALCDALRSNAYSTMEMRQLPTPKHELKNMVDRHMANVNSRLRQYMLINDAYLVELVDQNQIDLVAQEFAEAQYQKCMDAQGN